MKITTEQLKSIIRETIAELNTGTQFSGQLDVVAKPDGGWVIRGTFNGHPISIDSSYKAYPASIGEWDNSPRFVMARELLGHFGKENEHFRVRAKDLDNVKITVNGVPV